MFQFASFASILYFFKYRSRIFYARGCPIRISTNLRLLTTLRGFSQPTTSFFASERQNIHHIPLISYISIFLGFLVSLSFSSLLVKDLEHFCSLQDSHLSFSILLRRSFLELFFIPILLFITQYCTVQSRDEKGKERER